MCLPQARSCGADAGQTGRCLASFCGVTPIFFYEGLVLRGTQRTSTLCPTAGTQALASVSKNTTVSVPLRARTALQSAVYRSVLHERMAQKVSFFFLFFRDLLSTWSCDCLSSTRLDSLKNPCHIPSGCRVACLHPHKFFPSFGVHESCGEVSAVAELVTTTPICTRDFCHQGEPEQGCARKRGFERPGISSRLDVSILGDFCIRESQSRDAQGSVASSDQASLRVWTCRFWGILSSGRARAGMRKEAWLRATRHLFASGRVDSGGFLYQGEPEQGCARKRGFERPGISSRLDVSITEDWLVSGRARAGMRKKAWLRATRHLFASGRVDTGGFLYQGEPEQGCARKRGFERPGISSRLDVSILGDFCLRESQSRDAQESVASSDQASLRVWTRRFWGIFVSGRARAGMRKKAWLRATRHLFASGRVDSVGFLYQGEPEQGCARKRGFERPGISSRLDVSILGDFCIRESQSRDAQESVASSDQASLRVWTCRFWVIFVSGRARAGMRKEAWLRATRHLFASGRVDSGGFLYQGEPEQGCARKRGFERPGISSRLDVSILGDFCLRESQSRDAQESVASSDQASLRVWTCRYWGIFVSGRARAGMRKKAWLRATRHLFASGRVDTGGFLYQGELEQGCARKRGFERPGISSRLERVDTGAEHTKDHVMRLSWLQKSFFQGSTTRWNTTPWDTRGGQDGDPCRQPAPPEPQTPTKKRSWPWCVPVQLRIGAGTGSPL